MWMRGVDGGWKMGEGWKEKWDGVEGNDVAGGKGCVCGIWRDVSGAGRAGGMVCVVVVVGAATAAAAAAAVGGSARHQR